MPSKGFTLIELVILALVIGVITFIALPSFTASLSNVRASKQQLYVAAMQTNLVQLLMAEEDYFRDSLKYGTTVVCTTPPTRGALNFCPARGNVLAGPELVTTDAGLGWRATMTNLALPNVHCAIFVGSGAPYPAVVEGTPLCRRPGWSGRANDTTGQIN
jgi:Tfp pilus assembly protein PilE